MKKGGIGGANTNKSGLPFEDMVDLKKMISSLQNYEIRNNYEIFYLGKKVGEIYKKHDIYKYLLKPKGIDHKKYLSSKLLPDTAIYILHKNTLYIIEIKKQSGAGSTDEKLQTADFKRKQYQRLFFELGINIEYCYILDEWFKKPKYNDVLNYLQSINCKVFWGTLPLDYSPIFDFLGLEK